MTSREFCYWLQGLFELKNPKALNKKQTELLRRHLQQVFDHEISLIDGINQDNINGPHVSLPPRGWS